MEMGELWWGTLSGKVFKHVFFFVQHFSYSFAQVLEPTAAWVHEHCQAVKSVTATAA